MKICGIICEYNPFHNGHKYHIEKTKEKFGATHIIGVMSGNFTQRGDVAVIDKYKRAETALKNGVDLIIELPVIYSLGSAEQFAYGAVSMLNKLNCVDILSFGSECGDIELLKETAGAVHFALDSDRLMKILQTGCSFPTALQKTIEEFYEDDIIETLATPNNTLGIEYIKALDNLGSSIEPVTVQRYGAAHDSDKSENNYTKSASCIRKMIINHEDCSMFIPEINSDNFATLDNIDSAIICKLRSMSKEEFEEVPNVLQGLENRIYSALRIATNTNELFTLLKTRRYTMARLRRIVMCAFLGITKNDLKNPPAYGRILGMNSRGKEILSVAKAEIPLNTSLKPLMKTSSIARSQGRIEENAGNMYAMALNKKKPCGLDFTSKPIILD